VEVDRGANADGELEAGNDANDELDDDVKEESELDGQDDVQAEVGNSLDGGKAGLEDDLDLDDDANDDSNVDLDSSVNAEVKELLVKRIDASLGSVEDIGQSGVCTRSEDLRLALHNLNSLGDSDVTGCNSIVASSESFVVGCSGHGEGREGSDAENEEGLERRHFEAEKG